MLSKNIIRFSRFAVILLLAWNVLTGTAVADTYNVNASVPYEAPTQAATVNIPANATVSHTVQQTLTGTCQVKNPPTIVSVWRGSTVLGSTECVAGSFRLAVMLQIGQNTLIVRTANASGVYGPDSSGFTLTVEKPAPVEPLPPGTNQPTTATGHEAATNQGGVSGLVVTTEAPYTVLPSTKTATINVVVRGGQRPYVLQLKWGDGSTESHSLNQEGTYEFTHTYLARKTYNVYVYVRDVLGAYTEYVYAVVSGQKAAASPSSEKTPSSDAGSIGSWRVVGIVWYYWLLILIAAVFFLSSYVIGYRRGRERSEIEAEKRVAATKQKKKNTIIK